MHFAKLIILYTIPILLIGSCNSHSAEAKTNSVVQKIQTDSIRFNPEYTSRFPRNEVTETYCRAVSEYINSVYKDGKAAPDTLFIGLKDGEFPEIELPPAIDKINVKLVTIEESTKYLHSGKPLVHLNVMGWREKNKSEFMIVTFFEGGKPQHNCRLHFTHYPEKNDIKLDTLYFEYPYSK